MAAAEKVMLVGWDAADWKMIHPLMDAGYMPALKGLVERGTSGNLATLSPILSPMLWSSIATGKRPFKHGVHGFTEPTPDGKGVRPVTSLSRKTNAIWNILTLEGRRSHVVGWWPSHPAEPINGVMVSNQYQRAPKDPKAEWPMRPGTVHPERLAKVMEELRFHPAELGEEEVRLFVPNGHKIDQDKDRRLDSLMRILADCTTIHAAATHLIEHEPWDFCAVYYDAIDHFGHGFMKYHPPRQDFVSEADFEIYNQVVMAGYIYHDLMLARLLELAGEDTTVLLISDHGFHPDHLRPSQMPLEPAGPAIEHRDQGIFVMAGPGVKRDHVVTGANLLDICPTVLTALGLPVGEDMDGRPLTDAFVTAPEIRSIPSWDEVPGDPGRLTEDPDADPDAARENLEQLVALGYIEKPDDNQEKAVANTIREQNYNLAMAYMDAGMHPKAAELLIDLYRGHPLEFRFGLRLALCYQAMEAPEPMAAVIAHLNENWRRASERARARLKDFAEVLKTRREERSRAEEGTAAPEDASGQEIEAEIAALDADHDEDAPEPAPMGTKRPPLIAPAERQVVRTLRGIARGNPQTLDTMAASVAEAQRQPEEALEHLERARESGSKSPGFHLQLANASLRLARLAEARESFARVVELDPENPGAHIGLARVALREGRLNEALTEAKTAVGLKFASAPAHFFHGMALHRLGRAGEAIPALKQAVKLNPNFPEAHVLLALIHRRRLRDPVTARDHLREAREIRAMRREQAKARAIPELPVLETVDIDAELPAWPARPKLVAPLAAKPVAGEAPAPDAEPVFIVSGLPRSGTSMAMQMLVAGGVPAMTDGARDADENNPRGYLEYDPVKRLQQDNTWLGEAVGRALKVVTPLVPFLPQAHGYRIVMMERDVAEIVASQTRMLGRLEREGADLEAKKLETMLASQVEGVKRLLEAHGVPLLTLAYREAVADPEATAQKIAGFLGRDLDVAAMVRAVDPSLWRERSTTAEPTVPTAAPAG